MCQPKLSLGSYHGSLLGPSTYGKRAFEITTVLGSAATQVSAVHFLIHVLYFLRVWAVPRHQDRGRDEPL